MRWVRLVSLLPLAFAAACGSSDDNGGGAAATDAPGTIEANLRFVVQRFADLTDGLDRLVAAAESDGTGDGVNLVDGGLFVTGTLSLNLDNDPSTNETDVPLTIASSLPVDFSSGVTVSLTGPAGSRGVPLATSSVRITKNSEDQSILVSSDTGEFVSESPEFTMITFNTMLTVSADRSSLTGTSGYETFREGSSDFSFGSMTFRSTGSGFAIDVAETEGAYSFTVE